MGKKKGGVRIKQMGPKMPAAPPMNPMEALANISPDEMVNYVPPNRDFQIIWPIHESFSMKTDDFQIIYPSYLDKEKSIGEGRRIGLDKAVPTPTVTDISMALQQLSCKHVLQPQKGYSRDPSCMWDNPGRVLVDVSNYSKKELLSELATRIPDLPERQKRLQEEEEKRLLEEEKRKEEAAASKTTVSSTNATKKKGKKGRRK